MKEEPNQKKLLNFVKRHLRFLKGYLKKRFLMPKKCALQKECVIYWLPPFISAKGQD